MIKEEVFEGLKDLILSLKRKDNFSHRVFMENWFYKRKIIDDAINALNKDDFEWVESSYKEWIKGVKL